MKAVRIAIVMLLAFWFYSQFGLGLFLTVAEAQDPGVWGLYNWSEMWGGLFDTTWQYPSMWFGPHSTYNGGPPPGYFGEGGYQSWSTRPVGTPYNAPIIYGYSFYAPGLSPAETWPGMTDWKYVN